MKAVTKLYRFSSDWKIKKVMDFTGMGYCVDIKGNLYLNDVLLKLPKPDGVKTYTYKMTDIENNRHRFKLHQIVLQTFKPEGIRDGYSCDHKDRFDRLNNSLDNLRWADRSIQYKNRDNRAEAIKKEIICINNGKIYKSCKEAEVDLNLVMNTVSRVARGERKSIHGYKFKFIEEGNK